MKFMTEKKTTVKKSKTKPEAQPQILTESGSRHVMVDIETLGVAEDAVVLSVAAVPFDPIAGRLTGEAFYQKLDKDKQGPRTADPQTLFWWLDYPEAYFESRTNPVNPQVALPELASLFDNVTVVWANGVMFDISKLEHLYRTLLKREAPWGFRQVSCMRTLRHMLADVKIEVPAEGPAHSALADAKWQAKWVIEAYKALGLARPEG